MKFTELDLHPKLLAGIQEAEFVECTPVQTETFQHSLASRDVLVQSQTGTGKTAAFLITILDHFLRDECRYDKRALVVAPTRELAIQIEREAKLLGSHTDFTIGTFYGGVGYGQQEQLLRDGVDIAVATPGRLIDFANSRKLDLSSFGFLVIDEADRLFDMGFLPDIRKILKKMRPREERMTMLFSATLGSRVGHLAWEYMQDAAEISIAPEQVTVETVTQELYHVSSDRKMPLLLGILQKENPETALIFTNTKRAAFDVSRRLEVNGYSCEFIMGDLTQSKRLKVIDALKAGTLKFLVATDVAARGLHINDLDLVVNYDLPENPEGYVHRIGRTARAGKEGKAVSLACERFVYGLEGIEAFTGIKIPVAPLSPELFLDDRSRGMHFRMEHSGQSPRDRTSRTGPGRRDSRPDGRKPRAHNPHPHSGAHAGHSARPDTRRPIPSRPEPDQTRRSEPSRPPRERTPAVAVTAKRPKRDGSPEERLAYYRQKYGEDFERKG